MAQTHLADISRAARDADLIDRIVSAAAAAGVDNPDRWAEMNARRVVAQPVTPDGDTVASVHAYAVATYAPRPRPGEDAAAVTDVYLHTAVAAGWTLTDGGVA